ncbi:hypothetical protein JXA88_06365 [Candidatus Fermentibacteria bacterium]|nr:hypothetical protein [Candidatus Fermentibacteria bacterium]
MRLFGIESDGRFREYFTKPFQAGHEERVLEGWLESNPDGIVEDGRLLIVGRQVGTNLGSIIDLLALDREGDKDSFALRSGACHLEHLCLVTRNVLLTGFFICRRHAFTWSMEGA